jgi:hypothetical protein
VSKYKITATFLEPILGTVPKDENIYATYIGGKAEDADIEDELETVPSAEEKGWTGFHQEDGKPVLYDYVIKGFFKDACGMLRRAKGTKSKKLKAYKKVIDGLVFVGPRRIPIDVNGEEMGVLERPLRTSGPMGDRVALARSDTCPVGSQITFEVQIIGDEVSEKLLREWLDYGQNRGIGQWRNAGYGKFIYKMEVLS